MTLMAREQIETFKREGAVVLRQFIAKAQVDEWLDEYWRFMQADADDPSTWPGTPLFDLGEHFQTKHATNLGGQTPGSLTAGAGFRPGALNPNIPRLTDLPEVRELAAQLGGDGQVDARFPFDGHMIPRFPAEPESWQPPGAKEAHLDAYGPNGWTGGFNHGFGTVAYLTDIPECGGCFSYWRGSHRSCHEFFVRNPSMVDGGWRGSAEWRNFWSQEPHASRGGPNSKGKAVQVCYSTQRMCERASDCRHLHAMVTWTHAYACTHVATTKVVGGPGDLVVWHGWLMHAGTGNANPENPRLALFGSFRNTAMQDSGPPVFFPYQSPPNHEELRYAVPAMDDLWHFWGEAVRNYGGDEEVVNAPNLARL